MILISAITDKVNFREAYWVGFINKLSIVLCQVNCTVLHNSCLIGKRKVSQFRKISYVSATSSGKPPPPLIMCALNLGDAEPKEVELQLSSLQYRMSV